MGRVEVNEVEGLGQLGLQCVSGMSSMSRSSATASDATSHSAGDSVVTEQRCDSSVRSSVRLSHAPSSKTVRSTATVNSALHPSGVA